MKRRISTLILVLTLIIQISPGMPRASAIGEPGSIISAGNMHALAVSSDNGLYAWGWNGYGQAGSESVGDVLVPVGISSGAAAVSAGNRHSMAIMTDGSLRGWGTNGYGELGDGTTASRWTSAKVMDDVAVVSVGDNFTAAVKTDGSLWTWGSNESGRLANGRSDGLDVLLPEKVMDNVKSVAAHDDSIFILKTDGTLWACGNNTSGKLGDGTMETRYSPVQIMTGVKSVAAGAQHALAIKTDGSVWAWGNNDFGQLGNGTTVSSHSPVQIDIENVAMVSAGGFYSMALTTGGSLLTWGDYEGYVLGDGSDVIRTSPVIIMDNVAFVSAGRYFALALDGTGALWSWGVNGNGQLGDGSTVDRATPAIVKPDLRPASPPPTPPSPPEPPSVSGSGGGIPLAAPELSLAEKLVRVTDQKSAVEAVKAELSNLIEEAGELEDDESKIDLNILMLFAEGAIANASSIDFGDGDVVLNMEDVKKLKSNADETKAAVEKVMDEGGASPVRELGLGIRLTTGKQKNVKFEIKPEVAEAGIDSIRLETPDCALTVPVRSLGGGEALVITIGETPLIARASTYAMRLGAGIPLPRSAAASTAKTYTVSFNRQPAENVKISLDPVDGDKNYQAIIRSDGTAAGGKYNKTLDKVEAKIKEGDTYTVRENRKDFSDVAGRSKEMREAIEILASKGIIQGTSEKQFSPDGRITRAEIAALIVRTLSKIDPNADGGFSDVKKSDWYFGAVGSAKKYGIINGMSPTTFAPAANTQKDHIIAIAARTLKVEMRYKEPADAGKWLNGYEDLSEIQDWAKPEIAFATRENLVVKRSDGKFSPRDTMSRGDAAIVLYRLFNKIW